LARYIAAKQCFQVVVHCDFRPTQTSDAATQADGELGLPGLDAKLEVFLVFPLLDGVNGEGFCGPFPFPFSDIQKVSHDHK